MFIGHFAVGLASKKLAPQTNLAWLLAAPLFLDLLWPIFLIAGIEQAHIIPDAPTPFLVLGLDHYPCRTAWSCRSSGRRRWRPSTGRRRATGAAPR
jgi:hypothetical protein